MISENSRIQLTEIIQVADPVLGTLSQPEFVDLRERIIEFGPDDTLVTVTGVDSWATIGRDRLGDPRHYWAIADLSGVVDPFTELEAGAQLRSPSIHRFLFEVLAPENT